MFAVDNVETLSRTIVNLPLVNVLPSWCQLAKAVETSAVQEGTWLWVGFASRAISNNVRHSLAKNDYSNNNKTKRVILSFGYGSKKCQNLLICRDDGLAWHNCTGSTQQTRCWSCRRQILAGLAEERGQHGRRLNFRSPSNWHASMCFPNIVKIIINNFDRKFFYFDYGETYTISSCFRSAPLSIPLCCSSSRVEPRKPSQAGKRLGNVEAAKRLCSFASKHQVFRCSLLLKFCFDRFLSNQRQKKQSVRQDIPFCLNIERPSSKNRLHIYRYLLHRDPTNSLKNHQK